MAKQTRRDVGTIRAKVEVRCQMPDGRPLFHARVIGENFGIDPQDCTGGCSSQCIAELKHHLQIRGMTGRLRMIW